MYKEYMGLIFFFFFFLACTIWLVGSQFSDQGLEPRQAMAVKAQILTTSPPGNSLRNVWF